MSRCTLALFALTATASVTTTAEAPPPAAAPRRVDFAGPPGLQPGLSPAQVRAVLGGSPARVSSQLLANRAMEQWHYFAPHHLRLTFDSPRGQTPFLLASRSTAGQGP